MKVKIAKNFGFCFGVQRAIDIAEQHPNAKTIGPLIHNPKEISRLKNSFNIDVIDDIYAQNDFNSENALVIRTHGIPKKDMTYLQSKDVNIIDATCPFVTKPQKICEEMSSLNYQVIIFGDENHPEVKGVKSHGKDVIVIKDIESLQTLKLKRKVAVISQTTKKIQDYQVIINYLVKNLHEVRVFNTICNATFDNQDAALELSKEVDLMIVVGGKNSSNTKQLFEICKQNCQDSYLIEEMSDLDPIWFEKHSTCGLTAGASTPKWIIDDIVAKIKTF